MSNVPSPPEATIGPASGIAASTAGVLAPPPLIYLVALAVGFLIRHWYPVAIVGHRAAAPLGIACLALGLAIHLSAFLALRRAKTSPQPWRPTTAVVATGPYRFTRNPIYVAFSLVYIGVALWANTLWPMLLLLLVFPVMQLGVVAREEVYLERIFGDEYRDYRRRVRRWL